ncbi:hypothetical protein MSKU9_0286 [Komagataeibacter diospyri]|uniref:Uncharacterized protein n=1 Tax=Komagataeibacter diospyri TaxID=1932662 RepID=A0A4P5NRJ3_9PROT|nr:hypothetical protein MSKU9_0286 [Komagataeibacter diospyri]
MAMIFVDHPVTLRLAPFFRSPFCPLVVAVNPDHRTVVPSHIPYRYRQRRLRKFAEKTPAFVQSL